MYRYDRQERNSEIRDRVAAGESQRSVATALGISHTCVQRVMIAAETDPKIERDKQIRALFDSGVDLWTVSETLGIGLETVKRAVGYDKIRDDLLVTQGRCCAICGTQDPPGGQWNLDHDHTTRKIRGVLCSMCNKMLGCALDDVGILARGIAYLVRSRG